MHRKLKKKKKGPHQVDPFHPEEFENLLMEESPDLPDLITSGRIMLELAGNNIQYYGRL